MDAAKHLLEVHRGRQLKESPENSRPVGTGPYRFQEWKSGEKVVLVSNNEYYEGRPYLGRIVYRVIPNQGTIFLELKAKGVDLASLTAIQYARQTEYPAFRKAFRKYRYPSSAYTYFGFNLKDPRFADRRVRQAFAHAIDKQELMEGVLMGLAREATGPIRPGSWAYTNKVTRYDYSPVKAKALLAEAGWKDNRDGVLRDKDGKAFSFTIRTNQGNEERKKVAEIIQQRLAAIGVKTEIQVIEWASFIKEFIKKKRFEAVVLGWVVGTDPDQYGVWHSSQMDRISSARSLRQSRWTVCSKRTCPCHQRSASVLPIPGGSCRGSAAHLPTSGCARWCPRAFRVFNPPAGIFYISFSGMCRSKSAVYLRLDALALRRSCTIPSSASPSSRSRSTWRPASRCRVARRI